MNPDLVSCDKPLRKRCDSTCPQSKSEKRHYERTYKTSENDHSSSSNNDNGDIICEDSILLERIKEDENKSMPKHHYVESQPQRMPPSTYFTNQNMHQVPMMPYHPGFHTGMFPNMHFNAFRARYESMPAPLIPSAMAPQKVQEERLEPPKPHSQNVQEVVEIPPQPEPNAESKQSAEDSQKSESVEEDTELHQKDESMFDIKSVNSTLFGPYTQSEVNGHKNNFMSIFNNDAITQSAFGGDDDTQSMRSASGLRDMFNETTNVIKDDESVRLDFNDFENESTADFSHLLNHRDSMDGKLNAAK